MTLKRRILIDKLLIPVILLFVLVIYIIKEGMYLFNELYGFYLFYFVLWILVSTMIISKSTNHLIKYNIESEHIKLTIYKKLYNVQQIDIPINSIKNTKLQTRSTQFGFDILKIYYLDEDELNDLLELRISDKKDWMSILSKIEKIN
tara:strand:+ start:1192 stop:1632 length:441 start_codon:yes stop_codon:yes gene_type:complete